MPQIEVTLPSGARGVIRGLKGEEINLFANRQTSRRGRTSMQILKNVWLETIDSGPAYSGEKVEWEKAPACDRFTALFKARVATYGASYVFKYQCEDCRKRFEWEIDLETDLVTKPLPDASIETFLNGNRFTTTVVDPEGADRSVVFQLLTTALEAKIEQVQNLSPKEKATASLAQRIVSVSDLPEGKHEIKKFLNNLDAGAMLDLVEAMDSVDGGIETDIEIECPHCGYIMEVDLPLRQEFWSPSRRRRSTST